MSTDLSDQLSYRVYVLWGNVRMLIVKVGILSDVLQMVKRADTNTQIQREGKSVPSGLSKDISIS